MTNEELAVRIQNGETTLLEDLWKQIERLIQHKAYRYSLLCDELCTKAGITWDDLYQVGFFALCEAIKGYDPSSGLAFVTYLTFPYRTEFHKLIGHRTSKRDVLNLADSLDSSLESDDDTFTLAQLLADPSAEADLENVIEAYYADNLHQMLEAAIDKLPEKQRVIVRGRYFKGMRLSELAAQLNLTPASAHDLEVKARVRLRRNSTLLPYRDEIISRYAYRGGYGTWKYTGLSPQEKTVIELESKGL